MIAASGDADARGRRGKRAVAHGNGPMYAAIVVDANSGSVLHAANPDALRHPASLTKIMTLYMLFERLEAGTLSLDSPLTVSAHAAAQSPTKLGLREGSTITAEEAIKGMVTRSANDAAVVVAENLAGSEAEFARQMTRKARALGMTRTTYHNASGLPDPAQVTTARDQATLGRAIQERFPRYYRYFSTRTFSFRGQRIGNHNRLLGRVEGVDGIKTGYIRASGFNLVTSLKRDNRYVVAVVLGGVTAGARDARMRHLLAEYVDRASTRRTAPMIAEARPTPRAAEPAPAPRAVEAQPAPRVADAQTEAKAPDRFEIASASSVIVPMRPPGSIPRGATPAAGSAEPIRPVAVRTVAVRPPVSKSASKSATRVDDTADARVAATSAVEPATPAQGGVLGYLPVQAKASPIPAPDQVTTSATRPASRAPSHSGWIIQVGAFPDEAEAQQRLASVKSKAPRLLGSASPFTETVRRGDTRLYRARFAVLDREQAEAACKFLRRNDVDCLAIRN